jgi:hypothetical protein
MVKRLDSYDAVLEALGGARKVAELCDQQANAPYTWRSTRGKFPSKYYFVMKGALRDAGYWAPIRLWGFHSKGEHYRGPKKRPRRRKTTQADNDTLAA